MQFNCSLKMSMRFAMFSIFRTAKWQRAIEAPWRNQEQRSSPLLLLIFAVGLWRTQSQCALTNSLRSFKWIHFSHSVFNMNILLRVSDANSSSFSHKATYLHILDDKISRYTIRTTILIDYLLIIVINFGLDNYMEDKTSAKKKKRKKTFGPLTNEV